MLRQLHEALLQVWRQGHGQGASVDHQRDVRGRIHVTRVVAVSPHLFQRAAQDGRACELENNEIYIADNIMLIVSEVECNDVHLLKYYT